MLHRMTIPAYINAPFLRSLTTIGSGLWGFGPDASGNQNITFEPQHLDSVLEQLELYDAAWLESKKKQKLEELANVRREKEVLGPNGLYLDDKTVARLTAAAVGLMINTTRQSVTWEVTRGNFQVFSREVVMGLAAQAVEHVQACFENVATKTAEIKAVTLGTEEGALDVALAQLEAIDITSGWPT